MIVVNSYGKMGHITDYRTVAGTVYLQYPDLTCDTYRWFLSISQEIEKQEKQCQKSVQRYQYSQYIYYW